MKIDDLTAAEPPAELPPAGQALWWLRKGDLKVGREWERAHAISQAHEGEREHDLIHALAHWIEGDTSNRDYWYRRAGAQPTGTDVELEWAHLAASLHD